MHGVPSAAASQGGPVEPAQRRWRSTWALLGPAFVAAVAYVDPGNFATNFAGGASYGYRLLWVIVAANLMAMLIQSLTAKLGLATGRDLASLCREHLPRPVTWGLWVQAEAVAIATDLAEVVGGAVALNLLFGIPLPIGGLMTAAVAFGLLSAQTRGYRPFEAVVTGLLAVIALGFAYTLLVSGLDPGGLARGLVPGFTDTDSVLLASGILGATVMPHVIYVHSALTPGRYRSVIGSAEVDGPPSTSAVRRVLRAQRLDVLLAMGGAGLINATMLIVAAQLFAGSSAAGTLEGAHASLASTAGSGAALAFALALLASGFAASSVGTFAGQVVMAGFLQRQIPLWVRRGLTLAPALVVLGLGADPTTALVWSQVVLSFGIPFALIPLVIFTARQSLMGDLVNRAATTLAASAVAALIVGLNAFLLWDLAT
ncbi:Nramp family divalent metal transporter [Actinotalea solisilvae]|uniref:Nramp family divalent metal transporter n=1 Tax=Actinotalea solisilvae TaxID=2072922 RepID=UPI0027DCE9AE|nr:Nramp family divalent metal transporter [Actinotalea solisilvae]